MRNGKALRTLADIKTEPDEVQAIHLALHLGTFEVMTHVGLYEDAMDQARALGRYDLVSDMLQACNKWEKALEVSAAKDRQSLPSTFFKFGRHLQDVGDSAGAIAAYEKSNTHR